MWYRAVGCFVTLALSLLVVPLTAETQPAGQVARIGFLSPGTATAANSGLSRRSPMGVALKLTPR
jgi:hypothetical protein